MLHADGNGFPITIESFIRNSMKTFPFIEMPAFRDFVTTVSKTKIVSTLINESMKNNISLQYTL